MIFCSGRRREEKKAKRRKQTREEKRREWTSADAERPEEIAEEKRGEQRREEISADTGCPYAHHRLLVCQEETVSLLLWMLVCAVTIALLLPLIEIPRKP